MTRCRPCATSSIATVCEEFGVDHVVRGDRKNDWIDLAAICDDGLRRLESVLQQSRDQGVPIQSTVDRPILRIEIAIHQELGKEKKPRTIASGVTSHRDLLDTVCATPAK